MSKPELKELVKSYKALYPAAITDIMDTDYGLHNQWLTPTSNRWFLKCV